MRHQITDTAIMSSFVQGGNARFTIENTATGTWFTYQVRAMKNGNGWFVSVLTGSDNENDYSYLGCLWADRMAYVHGKKSRVSADAPSARGFAWFARQVFQGGRLPEPAAFHHEGRCCRCGRTLTTPESVETGIGPVCAKM